MRFSVLGPQSEDGRSLLRASFTHIFQNIRIKIQTANFIPSPPEDNDRPLTSPIKTQFRKEKSTYLAWHHSYSRWCIRKRMGAQRGSEWDRARNKKRWWADESQKATTKSRFCGRKSSLMTWMRTTRRGGGSNLQSGNHQRCRQAPGTGPQKKNGR